MGSHIIFVIILAAIFARNFVFCWSKIVLPPYTQKHWYKYTQQYKLQEAQPKQKPQCVPYSFSLQYIAICIASPMNGTSMMLDLFVLLLQPITVHIWFRCISIILQEYFLQNVGCYAFKMLLLLFKSWAMIVIFSYNHQY